jgi:MFS transporter, PAT family, beta-lactamase induction signal transducer AmpG
MQPPERESTLAVPERPWIFNFLIAPMAVMSMGLAGGALSFLFRHEGVNPAQGASLVALITLPHTIYFAWSPLTDFWIRRRTWLLLGAAAAAIAEIVAFHQTRLASPLAIALMFLAMCLGGIVVAACGGIMGALRDERNRRRASSYYQVGSLAFGAVAVFILVSRATGTSLSSLGWIVAALIVLPALFVFAAPPQPFIASHSFSEVCLRFAGEFRQTFFRWQAIPYVFMIMAPSCSGAMIGLLPALAADYGVTGQQVAWINGLGGALLSAAGAYLASLIPVRVRASVAFPLAGLVNAATLAVFALGPLSPAVYFAGTVLFLFTVGACYTLFTCVALEFLGVSGKSGSTRYAIINSFGNLPVVYMEFADGRAYAHWGPRAEPGIDAVLSAAAALLFLAHFTISRHYKQAKMAAE